MADSLWQIADSLEQVSARRWRGGADETRRQKVMGKVRIKGIRITNRAESVEKNQRSQLPPP